MAKRRHSKKQKLAGKKSEGAFQEVLSLYATLADLKKEMGKVAEGGKRAEDRLTDLEIHVNILARLLTTLCIERLGMGAGALKRLVFRVEKEAVRDSQVMELESLFKLSRVELKKTSSTNPRPKDDPWDQIS